MDDEKKFQVVPLWHDVCTQRCFHVFDRSFSGTGDLFASVLCGCRTKGICTEDAILLAGKFLSHSIWDTMKENTPGRDGVNFEKFLIDLIADSNV